jgi:hypothetical protein
MSLGSWIICLILGLVAVLCAPLIPNVLAARIVKIIGIVLLVLAAVLFLLWVIGLLAGGTAVHVGLALLR